MTPNYWIAQYVEDLFRNEPRNVGVLVQIGGDLVARFVGENEYCHIDGRKLKGFAYPDVYKQWVHYWREQIEKKDISSLLEDSSSHFRVIQAGQVTDIDHDTSKDVVNYLYALLVSEGGFNEAICSKIHTEESEIVLLEDDITTLLSANKLLSNNGDLIVPHPIKRRIPIVGFTKTEHKPAFVQENGRLYIMEIVDFTTQQKGRSRDHAGLSAYMFHDIKKGRPDTENIALIKVNDEDQDTEDIAYGLKILRNEADIINWQNTDEKDSFLEARKTIAMSN